MNITPQQAAAIKKVVRAANRRIERAQEKSPGQARYIESVVKKATGGASKFSAVTKGLTYEQAAKKIEALNRFMAREATKRKGWEDIRLKAVHAANEKLEGYELTDEELADIMIQVDDAGIVEYYRAVNLVTVEKKNQGKKWEGTYEQIEKAINQINEVTKQRISYQQSLQMALEARPGIKPPKFKKK